MKSQDFDYGYCSICQEPLGFFGDVSDDIFCYNCSGYKKLEIEKAISYYREELDNIRLEFRNGINNRHIDRYFAAIALPYENSLDIKRPQICIGTDPYHIRAMSSWMLLHARRVNLAAKGTKHIGFFSPMERVPSKLLWTIKNIEINNAKILSIWYNSSIHLLQIILNRIETGGAYIEIGKYSFKSIKIINPDKLDFQTKTDLLDLFEELKSLDFPIIMEQLKDEFIGRTKIDEIFLRIFGFTNIDERKTIGVKLRKELFNEIRALKQIMKV